MIPIKKNAIAGQAMARARNEHNTQYSFFHSIINISFSDLLHGSATGERVLKRAPLPGYEPDFNKAPWPGVMRAIYWSYRLDLPSLRAWTLETIKQDALRK